MGWNHQPEEVGCIFLCVCFNSSSRCRCFFFIANKVYTSDQLSFTIIPQENIQIFWGRMKHPTLMKRPLQRSFPRAFLWRNSPSRLTGSIRCCWGPFSDSEQLQRAPSLCKGVSICKYNIYFNSLQTIILQKSSISWNLYSLQIMNSLKLLVWAHFSEGRGKVPHENAFSRWFNDFLGWFH